MSRVYTIPNFLTSQECSEVLAACNSKLELRQAVIGKTKEVNLKHRKSSVAFIEDLGSVNSRLIETLTNNVKVKGFSVSGLEHFQFTEYKQGEFYNWHKDSATDNPEFSDRFYSTVIQLNNNYTDGELEVIEDGEERALTKGLGTLYMFPSYLTHRVRPISTGTRYSLVSWIKLVKNINEINTLI